MVRVPERRFDDRDLSSEFVAAIVAVSSGLLAVGGDAVPDKLVCYATVTDEANGDVGVLNYGGVFLDLGDLANEWTGTAVSASPLALVACSGSPFTQLE
jgi:hypothetical protein